MRLLASLLVCAFALPLQAEEKVLNLYNWADYVPQQALQRFQAVSLYVNDYNTAALRTYERVGFQRHGTFATVLF